MHWNFWLLLQLMVLHPRDHLPTAADARPAALPVAAAAPADGGAALQPIERQLMRAEVAVVLELEEAWPSLLRRYQIQGAKCHELCPMQFAASFALSFRIWHSHPQQRPVQQPRRAPVEVDERRNW